MWSWDEVQHLFVHAKTCESHDMMIRLCLHQVFCVCFIYSIKKNMCVQIQFMSVKLVEKFKGLCAKRFNLDCVIVPSFLEELDHFN